MPRYLRPPTHLPADVEAAIDALSTPFARAVVRTLAQHGSATSGQLATALQTSVQAVQRTLLLLEDSGLLRADFPAGERTGRRVAYSVDHDRLDFTLDALGAYLHGR